MAKNYQKTTWTKDTAINPSRLNNIEEGVKAACDGVDALETQDLSSRFTFASNDYFDVTSVRVLRSGHVIQYAIGLKTKQALLANCNYFVEAASYASGSYAEGYGWIVASLTQQGSNSYSAKCHYANGKLNIEANPRGMNANYSFTCTLVGYL